MTTKKQLREELTSRLIPEIQRRGFAGPNAITGNKLLHEFRRPAADGTHILTVQFDKHQRPRFILNLYIEPSGGPGVLIGSGRTVFQGRACPRRGIGTGAWFRADRPWWQRLIGIATTREREAVSAAIAMLEEIEQWWATQQASPHIGVLPITYRKHSELNRNANHALQRRSR